MQGFNNDICKEIENENIDYVDSLVDHINYNIIGQEFQSLYQGLMYQLLAAKRGDERHVCLRAVETLHEDAESGSALVKRKAV